MKKFFLFLSIFIVLVALPITVFFVGKNQELRKKAAPASTLSLTPATLTKKVGDTFSLDVKLDAAENQVGTIQIRLTYDPAKLEALDIVNGALAPSIRVSGKIDASGKASITVGARSSAQPITGEGTVAVVTMKALETTDGPTAVRFAADPETFANALDEGESNVLIGTTPANITITDANGAENAITTLTPTPTLTLTPTGSISPTATPSGTINPTATPSATPTATPTGQQGSQSNLTISSIQPNDVVASNPPTFSGTAPAGTTVTLTIYSEPKTVVVTVDANGNWTYTPQEGLDNGPHTVVALATNPSTGETQTTTVPFVVSDGTSQETIPTSGSMGMTLVLITFATVLLIVGLILPAIISI